MSLYGNILDRPSLVKARVSYCYFSVVIAKVFRQADTEETGHVDVSYITDLAAGVLGGQNVKESEKALIKFHADSKKGISLLQSKCFYFDGFH